MITCLFQLFNKANKFLKNRFFFIVLLFLFSWMKFIFKCMFDSFDYHIFVWQLMDRGVIGVSGARALWLAGEEDGPDLAPVTTPPPLMEDWIVRGICRTSAIVTLTPVLRWPQDSTNRCVALGMMCPRGGGGVIFYWLPSWPSFPSPQPLFKNILCLASPKI